MPLASKDNPYSLTLESDLETLYDDKIARFWEECGERHYFAGVDDVTIAYMRFVHPTSDTGLVISSGRTESFIKYKELIYDFWRQGFSVYILDHRGQGLSGRILQDRAQMGHVRDFGDYVADLRTLVGTVVRPAEHRRLALLAHSMGGAIASLYIEEYKSDFDAAVLFSPM